MKPMSYSVWLTQIVYLSRGITEVTMEEAMLDFFYNGTSRWIKGTGYRWILTEEKYIANKFLRFAYDCYYVLKQGHPMILSAPEPRHRNLQEDRDTFEMYADLGSFIDFLHDWDFRDEIVGTPLEYMIREFCYTWVDVTAGKPGKWTQTTLDIAEDYHTDEDNSNILPDGSWSRRKYDLY